MLIMLLVSYTEIHVINTFQLKTDRFAIIDQINQLIYLNQQVMGTERGVAVLKDG